MKMLIYMMLQSFRKRTIYEMNQDVLDDAADCINRLLPTIQKELGIHNFPPMQFIEGFSDNPKVYGLYSFQTGKLWISPHVLYNEYKSYNYYTLFFNLIYTITHELTHYKQHAEGVYDLEKYNQNYINVNNGFMKYLMQPIELEAYKNQGRIVSKNRKLIKQTIDNIIKERIEKNKGEK